MTQIFCPRCERIKGERLADRFVTRNGGDTRVSPLPVDVSCRCGCNFTVGFFTINEVRYTVTESNTEANAPTELLGVSR